jgi:arsenate reductase
MAEGLLRSISGEAFDVQSAGTNPSTVRPEAIKAMAEIGIDISKHRSKSVDEFAGANIDYVLTVCDNAREACPYFPAPTLMVHHSFEDPAEAEGGEEARLAAFRSVRDQIRDYLQNDFVKVINTT